MHYDRHKSFPHPVLCDYNRDYVGAAFQATLELKEKTKGQLALTGDFILSEAEIDSLLDENRAVFAAVVKCPGTYYRRAFTSAKPALAHDFEPGELSGRVDIYPFIVALEAVDQYLSSNFNPEFGGDTFDLPAGAVLALDQPKTYYVDQHFLRFGSVVELVKSDRVAKGEFEVSVEGEKIAILLEQETLHRMNIARSDATMQPFILTSLVLPALMDVLGNIKNDADNNQDKRWYQAILQQLDELGLDFDKLPKDALRFAQLILKQPLDRLPIADNNGG